MTKEIIQERVGAAFGNEALLWNESFGMLECTIPADQNLAIATFLFQELGFQFLTDLTGVHYPDNTGKELGIITHLHNLKDNFRLRMKAFVPVATPDIHSLTGLFSGADWMERETFDFYGINFVGHPNLKRILNVDEMDYFPMRKEYQMEDPTRMDKDDEMFGR
ncbi:NADH-quinone oxidoreductase subunit C [Taibaiella sp. KBW10]|uniref:NADH-quinone oxidoreductase subunit C n=1 Tax=Taibaiella sp. KBW10 TaxID=2153357 RepID=UPI000F590B3D|nr:NADH-quinone oxidoreductase subunit C [Taibaiella sp. KBW10]RQO31694.1 NADH-quinone oxidoreductase subunit C [Taibaiella sp. KBW10]